MTTTMVQPGPIDIDFRWPARPLAECLRDDQYLDLINWRRANELKTCAGCGKTKILDAFHVKSTGKKRGCSSGRCKDCERQVATATDQHLIELEDALFDIVDCN